MVLTWEKIPGWFDWADAYTESVASARPGGTIVEVGCWQGRSLAWLATHVRAVRKDLHIVGVDRCTGSTGADFANNHEPTLVAHGGTLAGALHRNLIACGLAEAVTLLIADSQRAARLFGNATLEGVFLDASHDEAAVRADIVAWLPKVRPGGWLGGHDYDPVWPGVIAAVDGVFGGAAHRWSRASWRYRVPGI